MIETLKQLRAVIEAVGAEQGKVMPGTRRHAELHIVWHELMNAYSLISRGRVTPDDLQWASEEANAILAGRRD